MTTKRRAKLTPSRAAVPTPAEMEWRLAERAYEQWSGLRITDADFDRVAAFLRTAEAPRLHAELVAIQEALRTDLAALDWTEVEAPVLLALMLMGGALATTRDHGFPPDWAAHPTVRWLVILYRLILAAQDAGRPALDLARRAMVAALAAPRPRDELLARARRHLGFDAAALALLRAFGDDDRATVARLRRAAGRQMPPAWRDALSTREQHEDLDGRVLEEIARRLHGRGDVAGLLDAVVEALPSGIKTASSWDYIARDTAHAIRRTEARRMKDGAHPRHRGDQPVPNAEAPPAEAPDAITAIRETLARLQADPKRAAALKAATRRGRGREPKSLADLKRFLRSDP